MSVGFRTVGHSNRGLTEFESILRRAGVTFLADVRRFPRSRSNCAFNIEILPDELSRIQIGYRHLPAMGGRRKAQRRIDDRMNSLWRNRSFHNYADYALSEEFGHALEELLSLGQRHRVAIMCSEAVWWRCHRRIITDYLILNGHEVIHLMGNGDEEVAKPTPGAQRTAEGKVLYPADPMGVT